MNLHCSPYLLHGRNIYVKYFVLPACLIVCSLYFYFCVCTLFHRCTPDHWTHTKNSPHSKRSPNNKRGSFFYSAIVVVVQVCVKIQSSMSVTWRGASVSASILLSFYLPLSLHTVSHLTAIIISFFQWDFFSICKKKNIINFLFILSNKIE